MATKRDIQNITVGQELDFLPAALEVQQRPPSPIGRAIAWSLMLLFLLVVVWATLGSVDIVAVAQGRIIPSGHIKVIQPLEMGAIKAIHVSEGDRVVKGEPLLALRGESIRADLLRIEQEIDNYEQEHRRLILLERWLENNLDLLQSSPSLDLLTPSQRHLLMAQWNEHKAVLKTLQAEKRKRQAEQASLQQQVRKLEATLPLVTKRAESLQKLTARKFVGEAAFLEMEQERLEIQHDLATHRKRADEIIAAIGEIEGQREQVQRKFHRQVLVEQQENRKQVKALDQNRIKSSIRLQTYTMYAPVAGVVQQLSVHTLGGIVTPAQQLMVIVPENEALEVEVAIENKDIGFVREGQEVEVKIDAFPFTRHGVIDAVLTDLSNDAISDEVRGLIYKAKVVLKETRIKVNHKWVNLSPGMTVTAEVKTGTRRLITFFLSPLLRYRQESIRER